MVECELVIFILFWFCCYSFNRYMVECEYLLSFHLMCMAVGFNRYMVECEYGLLSAGATDDDVLIDTWWNVNKIRS